MSETKFPYKRGVYKVTQLGPKSAVRRDFDASEWTYEWLVRGGVQVLLMRHDGDPDATDVIDIAEFSAPVSIEFEYEQ